MMKHKKILAVLLALFVSLLAACSTPSKITLNDGTVIYTTDKPSFDSSTGFYEYKSVDTGNVETVNKDSVEKIEEVN